MKGLGDWSKAMADPTVLAEVVLIGCLSLLLESSWQATAIASRSRYRGIKEGAFALAEQSG
jgi:hypothetical protein